MASDSFLERRSNSWKSHQKPRWDPLWDVSFLRIESATGRILRSGAGQRGARRSLDASGYFFEPLWTNFAPGEKPGSYGTRFSSVLLALLALAMAWRALR